MQSQQKAVRKREAPTKGGKGLIRNGVYETKNFYTHRLSLLNRLIARTTREMLSKPFGLSPMEWRVLVQLEYRSPSKIVEIHERSLFQKPQISSALPSLIKKGFAVREENQSDARAPYFFLTEEGLKLYQSVMRVSRKRQIGLEKVLSDEQRACFESAVDQLIATLTEEGPSYA